MKSVKIAQLKDQLSRYLRAVESGASIIVTDRNRPVAQLVPIAAEEGLELLEATAPFGVVRARRFPRTRKRIDSLALLIQERGDR